MISMEIVASAPLSDRNLPARQTFFLFAPANRFVPDESSQLSSSIYMIKLNHLNH